MPQILLVKTSSMGDVIHNLPVVTDIQRQLPNSVIDWVVEESFAEIPMLHPGVRKIVPVALRRWRKSLSTGVTRNEVRGFKTNIEADAYDVVLDTQGLLKSAVIALLANGERRGYAWNSAREPIASWFYQRRFIVDKSLHALERNRLLAAKAFGYELTSLALDYGIAPRAVQSASPIDTPYAVLLHATSRDDKLWMEENWIALGERLSKAGLRCELPWGSQKEKARSERLAKAIPNAHIPEAMTLNEGATLLAGARIVIGVDTGLTHLAAALRANVVALYTATSPGLTGVYGGKNAVNLGSTGKSPTVAEVRQTVSKLIGAEI